MTATSLKITSLSRRQGTIWEVETRGVLLVFDFPLIDPKLGDLLELTDTPLFQMVSHKNVVIHVTVKIPEGTQLFAKVDRPEFRLTQNQSGMFVGSAPKIWEDDRGDQHEGSPLFQVEIVRNTGPEVFTCNAMDADDVWGLCPVHHSLDLILGDWDANL